MRTTRIAATGALLAAALTLPMLPLGSVGADDPTAAEQGTDLSPAQLQAIEAGFQVAPKANGARRSASSLASTGTPNPFIANLPDVAEADYAGWRARLAADARQRAKSSALATNRARAGAAQAPAVHDEEEPDGTSGSNDTAADAERIPGFGTAANRNNRVRILGELADLGTSTPRALPATPEDNGSIELATDVGITGTGSVQGSATLGDGPHGSAGTGSNDFDFYAVDVARGNSLVASTAGTTSGVDTVLAVYDAEGNLVASNDDAALDLTSAVTYRPETPGTYYVMAGGFSTAGPLPADPFDSASGAGGAEEGAYRISIGSEQVDADFYSVRLRPGDVLGGVANGNADGMSVTKPDGTRMVGAEGLDASSLYPPTSPLPGGGNTTFAYVAEEAGWYAVEASGAPGDYALTVEAYRPGTQGDRGRTQTVLLDFAPGRVNAGTWGGPGVVQVSPFSAFVPKWGIPRASARQLENRILAVVRANLQSEVEKLGLNPDVNVEVLNARGNENLIGQENVSRVYVAGTIAETGLDTIGIAQYIDPGNYGHEDESIVLLDVLSDPADSSIASLNAYLTEESDRVGFVSRAVGNVTAHEVGHTIGNYHTDFANDVHNIMDSGGGFFAENLYGVGDDGIGGTADDENRFFETDTYSPAEGFTGLENTLNVTAWAYAGR